MYGPLVLDYIVVLVGSSPYSITRDQMTAIVVVRALGAMISTVGLHEPRRFGIQLPCKRPVREKFLRSALCATNNDVNRWAGTTILCTHVEFKRSAK